MENTQPEPVGKIHKIVTFLTNPVTAIIFAAISTVLFAVVALAPVNHYDARERPPELTPFVPSESSQFAQETTLVKTDFYVDDFSTFDVNSNNFVIVAYVWFQFDPNILPPKLVGNFSFEGGTISQKTLIDNTLIDNLIRVKYRVVVNFSSNLDHHRFPLADHRIFLTLTNTSFTSKEVIFQSFLSNFSISSDIDPQGWTLKSRSVNFGTVAAHGEATSAQSETSYPRVVFGFDFKKPGLREAMTIIIPMFLIYLLGLVALIIRGAKDSQTALMLAVGSISGILAYRYVIEAVSPKSGYMLISDQLTLEFFVATFIVFLRCAYDHAIFTRGTVEKKGEKSMRLDMTNIALFYGIQIGVIVATFFIVTG
jgi:hypothetical protein